MAFAGDDLNQDLANLEDDYCIVDKEDVEYADDHDYDNNQGQQKKKEKEVIRQFYFVKFHNPFVDPDLELRIERSKFFNNRIQQKKTDLLSDIQARERNGPLYYRTTLFHREYCYDLSYLRRALEKYWPESINEDPEEAIDPEIETSNLKGKIAKLTIQLGHGNHKLAEKNKMFRELTNLQRSKEKLSNDVKEAEARIPTPKGRWDGWGNGSKYDIQRTMRAKLERMRKKWGNPAEMRQCELRNLDQQLRILNEEQEGIEKCITMTSNKINEQAASYDDYITKMNKAKELAANNDLVALAELSFKQEITLEKA